VEGAVALAAKATRTSLTDCPWSKNKCRKKESREQLANPDLSRKVAIKPE